MSRTRPPSIPLRPRRRATALACVLLAGAATGCSSIEGDLDAAPLLRSAHHPEPGHVDADALGPFVGRVASESTVEWSLRPLVVTERRPWAADGGASEERVTSFLAPFGKYHSNPRITQLRFNPLFWWRKERTEPGGVDFDWMLFPLVFYGSTVPPPGAEAAGERADRYFALFPALGQINSFAAYDRFQFLAWPLLQRLTKTVFDQEESFTSIALLAGFTQGWPRGGSWHVLPLYMKSVWNYPPHRAPRYPEGADPAAPLPKYDKRSVLWPFVHWQRKDLDRGPGRETTMFAVWPLFKREVADDHVFWTFLWPFFRKNVEYPLARESFRESDDATAGTEPDRATVTDPGNAHVLYDVGTQAVWRYVRTAEYVRRRLLVFLYADYHTRPLDAPNRLDSTAILQPIGFWKRSSQRLEDDGGYRDDSLWLLAPVFQHHARTYLGPDALPDGRRDRFFKVWPLVSYERNADGSADVHAFSLLPLRAARFVEDWNDAWGVFFNLYRYERTPDAAGGAVRHTALMNLVKAYRSPSERSLSVPLLFTSRSVTQDGVRRFSRRTLLGMFGYEGEDAADGGSSRTLRLFWLPVRLR